MNAIAVTELDALKGRQMIELASRMSMAGRGSLTIPGEYLEVVITRR